jgi:hypothetical protein
MSARQFAGLLISFSPFQDDPGGARDDRWWQPPEAG